MKRKILILLSMLLIVGCFSFGLTACGDNNNVDQSGNGESEKHDLIFVEGKQATCTEGGTVSYWYCNDCGKYFNADMEEITDITIPAKGHSWGEWVEVTQPTCTQSGLRKHTCNDCQTEETDVVEATGHVLTSHGAEQSDCIHLGTVAYWTCDVCGSLYADEQALNDIEYADIFTSPTGHTFGGWVTEVEAGCTEDGLKKRSCSCGYTETEIIRASGHNVSGNTCTNCNAAATEELIFVLNSEGTGYICVGIDENSAQSETADLIISSQYEGKPVVEIGVTADSAFAGNANIQTVSIPDTVTEISGGAFENCISLTEVYIPESVKRIGNNAFAGCVSLESIVIPEDVYYVSSSAFSGCESVTYAVVPADVFEYIPKAQLETLKITSGSSVEGLEQCTSLKYFSVADSVEVIAAESLSVCMRVQLSEYGNAYYIGNSENRYSILVKAVSQDIETCFVHPQANVIARSAFEGCTALSTVKFSDNSVSVIGDYAFSGCTSLEIIDIPESVTSVGSSSFSDCTALKSIAFSDSVRSIGDNTFRNCVALENLSIPGVSVVGENAFDGCNTFKALEISMDIYEYFTFDGVEELKISSGVIHLGAFSYKTSLRKVVIGSGVKAVEEYPFDNCNIEELIIENGVKSIGYAAFRGNAFKEVTIPASVENIGIGIFEYCFYLERINVDENNRYYKSEDGVLFSRDGLSILSYPANRAGEAYIIPSGVTAVGSEAFFFCNNLISITVPEGVTEIQGSAFRGCSYLSDITLPDSINSIAGGAFGDTAYINSENNWENGVLYIGNHLIQAKVSVSGKYAVKNGTVTIAYGAFYGCTELVGVTLPNTVVSIGENAFYDCSSLASVVIPENVTYIGYGAFMNCSSLSNLEIGSNVSYIGAVAFSGCSSLSTITIPASVEELGYMAFADCTGLNYIYYNAESIEGDGDFYNLFANAGIAGDGLTLVFGDNVLLVPSAMFNDVNNQQDASGLKEIIFGSNIQKIGDYAFYNCVNLKNVSFPASLKEIGKSAFSGCVSFTTIDLPYGIEKVGDNAFSYCSSVTDVTIPEGVEMNSSALEGCNGIINIVADLSLLSQLPHAAANITLTGEGVIAEDAFLSGKGIVNLVIGDNITGIANYAFSNCEKLENVVIGNGVEFIDDYAFSSCDNLKTVTIGKSVKKIGVSVFDGCYALSEIYFNAVEADDLTYGNRSFVDVGSRDGKASLIFSDEVVRVPAYLCENARYLTDITFGENIQVIGQSAFFGCSSLTDIIIPDSVTQIGAGAFANSSVKSITFINTEGWNMVDYFNGTTSPVSSETFSNPEEIAKYLNTNYSYVWERS